MEETPLSASAHRINDMWAGMGSFNYSSNISLMESENTVGLYSSLPSQTQLGTPNYSQSALNGFMEGVYSEREPNECRRTLQESLDTSSTLANTHVIMYASNYVVRALMSGTTTITKNDSSVGTITSAGGTLSVASLAVGDIITFDKPAVIYNSTYPGSQGTYGGYAGYCFATRRDRYTKYIKIANLGKEACSYEILYTATGDANVTSLTSLNAGDIASGETIEYGAFMTTGQYFIQTGGLCVAWVGEAPSKDCVMLYPMSAEIKYGFFSQDGHVFATNNAESKRQDAGGGQTIKGRATDGVSADIITGLNSGIGNAYGCTSVNSNLRAGNYYAGDACAVYAESSASSETGTIYTAEGQADGNGSEMTSFTAIPAHARGACSGGGAAWVAIVGAGYSGSAPSYPLYADVVMRFASNGTFQDAQSFTGTTSFPPVKKAYWGNGSGTGTYFSAGDFFWSTVDVQGYQDTDATDKDETNMVMTNFITLPSPTAFSITTDVDQAGFSTAVDACSEGPAATSLNLNSPSVDMETGIVLFLDEDYNTPFNGEELYFYYAVGRDTYSLQIGYNGIVMEFADC